MEEQKKRNPLETEKEGKLIAKFAIPAIISMLVSSSGDLRSAHCGGHTCIFESVTAHLWGNREDPAIRTGLHGDYRIRNTVSNSDDGRESSDPCRQKSDIFDDVYADGSNH